MHWAAMTTPSKQIQISLIVLLNMNDSVALLYFLGNKLGRESVFSVPVRQDCVGEVARAPGPHYWLPALQAG